MGHWRCIRVFIILILLTLCGWIGWRKVEKLDDCAVETSDDWYDGNTCGDPVINLETENEREDEPLANDKIRLLEEEDVPVHRASNLSCIALFRGDEIERAKAAYLQSTLTNSNKGAQRLIHDTRDCDSFIRQRQYAQGATSQLEHNFPIAYSIMVYKDIEQFERLLRAIYRHHNLYCVHVDLKSPPVFHHAVASLVRCLDSVFVVECAVEVSWGSAGVLDAELACMRELWRHRERGGRGWRYLINLTGQEFPLKTNEEIVRVLKAFNGSNNIEGTVTRLPHEFIDSLSSPPCGVKVTKGSVHIAVSYRFVDYALHSRTAHTFLRWLRQRSVYHEEIFFSSLNHSPHLAVPGAYTGVPETDSSHYRFVVRFKNWGEEPFNWPCPGLRWERQICTLSAADLPLLAHTPQLYANKFISPFSLPALDCLEELYYNRTRLDIRRRGQQQQQRQQGQRQQQQQRQQWQQQENEGEEEVISQSDLELRWKRLVGIRDNDVVRKLLERKLDINFYKNLVFVTNHV